MNTLIWLALVSFGLSLILTPIFRDIFRSYGVVDEPDHNRKIHKYPIPRVGGIAVAASYVASFFIVQLITGILDEQLTLVWKVLPAACIIFAVGVVDDLWGLKPWQKLIGQVVAAGVACWFGVLAVDVVGLHGRAWWTIPVTILWLLACSNAFNLVDGMDGLAAGVGMFATLTMFIAAIMQKNVALAMATVPLAGCLVGFLCYNFNPATIFLGDSGSLLIGFLLGCYGIIWTQKSATLLGMTAPLMALSLPLVDVGLAITRRFLRRQPIFSADRGHIHHRLLDRGMSPRKAALLLYGICSIVAVFSLLQSVVHNNAVSSVIVLLFCAVAWVGIQYLEYAEFSLMGKMLFGGGLQRSLKSQLDLTALRKSVGNAKTAADCAKLVEKSAEEFGLVATHLRVAGEDFEGGQRPDDAQWEARITIGDGDWIDFVRVPGSDPGAALFLDALAASLIARVPMLRRKRSQPVTVIR
jgi:UDP-GlcNAc:undecaprenyl-phosphate/decaprenyl-phosphate GlcNAc-1-phosphate transferase